MDKSINSTCAKKPEFLCEICENVFINKNKLKIHFKAIQYMEATKITNVNLVVNHFLKQNI